MKHWHEVLPRGVMIDVHYEDLVDDLEGSARRAIARGRASPCVLRPQLAGLGDHGLRRPKRYQRNTRPGFGNPPVARRVQCAHFDARDRCRRAFRIETRRPVHAI
jgi:hypothetical protein